MKKGLFALVAFLGALGIGLFWLSGLVENRVEEARATGFAQCEAENAKKEVVEVKKEKAVQNVKEYKKAVIYSRPNSRLPTLIKRMRDGKFGG